MKTYEILLNITTPAAAQVKANSLEEAEELIKHTDEWASTIVAASSPQEPPMVEIVKIQEVKGE